MEQLSTDLQQKAQLGRVTKPSFFENKLEEYSTWLVLPFPSWLVSVAVLSFVPFDEGIKQLLLKLLLNPLVVVLCVASTVIGGLGFLFEHKVRLRLPPDSDEVASDVKQMLYRNGLLSYDPEQWKQQLDMKIKTVARKPNKAIAVYLAIPSAKTEELAKVFNGTRITRNVKQAFPEELHQGKWNYKITITFFNYREVKANE